MTVFYNTSSTVSDSTEVDSDGILLRPEITELKFSYCYADFWSDRVRKSGGVVWTMVNCKTDKAGAGINDDNGLNYGMTPGFLETLKQYVVWMRSIGFETTNLVRADNVTLKKGDRWGGPGEDRKLDTAYIIEYTFDSDTPGYKLFTAINLARFAADEYTIRADTLDNLSPIDFLTEIFRHKQVLQNLHMPWEDHHYLHNNDGTVEYAPKFDKYFGPAFYEYAKQYVTRDWGSTKVSSDRAPQHSGAYVKEFYPFYDATKKAALTQ